MSRRAILSRVACVSLLFMSFFSGQPVCRAQYAFEPSVWLEPDSFRQQASSIAADDYGRIGVVWWTTRADVRFAKSTDGGETFLPSVQVDTTLHLGGVPGVAFDSDGNPHVAWTGFELAYGKTQTRYARSTDGGASFLPGLYVAPDPTMWQYANNIAVDRDGNPMVVWDGNVSAEKLLYFSRSYDGGATFEAPVRVDPHPGYQSGPDIAVDDSGNIYISYSGDHWACNKYVFVVKSTDGGQTFGERVWADGDTSCSFTTSIGIVPSEGGPPDGAVMVVWNERKPPAYDDGVYITMSADGGSTFSDVVTVSDDPTGKYQPLLGIGDGGGVIVVWSEGRLRFSYSLDGGLTFSPEAYVDSLRTDMDNVPGLAMAAGGVPMVVRTGPGPSHSKWQVYFNKGKEVGVQESPSSPVRGVEFGVGPVWPNPFRRSTGITYSVPGGGNIALSIYDSSGRLVRALIDKYELAGSHSVVWDGTDSEGCQVKDGVYFCRVEFGELSKTRKMIMLR